MTIRTLLKRPRKRQHPATALLADVAHSSQSNDTQESHNHGIVIPDDFEAFAQQVQTDLSSLSQKLVETSQQLSQLQLFVNAGFEKFGVSPVEKTPAAVASVPSTSHAPAPLKTTDTATRQPSQSVIQQRPIPYDTMPHILENVIANAPWQSLFVLRQVFRSIRDLADATLVRHIIIESESILLHTGICWKKVRIPRPDWNLVPALVTAPRIVELNGAPAYENRVINILGALSHLKVVDYVPLWATIEASRPPAVSGRVLIVRVWEHSPLPILETARMETVYFKCHYRSLRKECVFKTELNMKPLKQVYFHFEAQKWYLPNHEHHPIISPHPHGPRVVDGIIELAIKLVARRVTVHLVDPKSWHPSWMLSTSETDGDIDMESNIVNAITHHGGEAYLKVLTKAQVREHFDAETYSLIAKNR